MQVQQFNYVFFAFELVIITNQKLEHAKGHITIKIK
jgi:hypothetical protein